VSASITRICQAPYVSRIRCVLDMDTCGICLGYVSEAIIFNRILLCEDTGIHTHGLALDTAHTAEEEPQVAASGLDKDGLGSESAGQWRLEPEQAVAFVAHTHTTPFGSSRSTAAPIASAAVQPSRAAAPLATSTDELSSRAAESSAASHIWRSSIWRRREGGGSDRSPPGSEQQSKREERRA
jgi:hypothetical protein